MYYVLWHLGGGFLGLNISQSITFVITTGSYSSEYRSSNYTSWSVQALLGMNISQTVMFVIARGKQWLNLTDGYTLRVLRQNNKTRVRF